MPCLLSSPLRKLLVPATLLMALASSLQAEETSPTPGETLDDLLFFYCYDCHDRSFQKGGLNLEETPFDLSDKSHFATWAHVFDRVQHGEMPPAGEDQPTSEEAQAFLAELGALLQKADRQKIEREGRVHGRRLTRVEYEHSLHDLLGIRIPMQDLLPADETGGDFETIAEAQQLSHHHLSQYLDAADQALEVALNRARWGVKRFFRRYHGPELTADAARTRSNYRGPQNIAGQVHAWARAMTFNGKMEATRVPEAGWYRIVVKNLHGLNPGPDGTVWGTLRIGAGKSSEPIHVVAGLIEATSEKQDYVLEAWMPEGHLLEIRPAEGTNKLLYRGPNYDRSKPYYAGRNLAKEGYAALVFDEVSLQRIYPAGKRGDLRRLLLPGLTFDEDNEPILSHPQADLNRLVTHFAEKAFRRPLSASEVAPYRELAWARFRETEDLFAALHEGYRAILCSPRFLTFVESPGPLDSHALASRLSYFLWSSIPDDHLRKLARENRLQDEKVLLGEVDRLLAHPKSERFIANFTDQWLELKNIDFTTPDPQRFRHFDPVVQHSFVAETQAFVRELFRANLSVRHFIRSDFAFLNTRLRTHYGLEEVPLEIGAGLQKVPLSQGLRSGLVTQGSILKVTADGSVTSPVIRGVWLGERILGRHIPPPPANVPAIEPDIRGATSIREQLEKHRADPGCAACHRKIDPPGFALESYDPTGQWRDFYGKPGQSAPVDPSGVTLHGRPFSDIQGWKEAFVQEPEILARAFSKNLLAYATGAEARFSDRPALEAILQKTKVSDYGLRSLLHAITTSEPFLSK
ncbi:DUF1592 domain-containing protein [Roseibacillus ishigakijimensis]|nr:DUF1592 domain-containing protein [Roseibacillus ishigakijimensis]